MFRKLKALFTSKKNDVEPLPIYRPTRIPPVDQKSKIPARHSRFGGSNGTELPGSTSPVSPTSLKTPLAGFGKKAPRHEEELPPFAGLVVDDSVASFEPDMDVGTKALPNPLFPSGRLDTNKIQEQNPEFDSMEEEEPPLHDAVDEVVLESEHTSMSMTSAVADSAAEEKVEDEVEEQPVNAQSLDSQPPLQKPETTEEKKPSPPVQEKIRITFKDVFKPKAETANAVNDGAVVTSAAPVLPPVPVLPVPQVPAPPVVAEPKVEAVVLPPPSPIPLPEPPLSRAPIPANDSNPNMLSPTPDGLTPEQICGITPNMSQDQIRQRLATLYRRYNFASASLNAGLRAESETALNAIVAVREKYFGPV